MLTVHQRDNETNGLHKGSKHLKHKERSLVVVERIKKYIRFSFKPPNVRHSLLSDVIPFFSNLKMG
jgi:hypothetical protein